MRKSGEADLHAPTCWHHPGYLQPKTAQYPAQAHLDVVKLRLHQLARRQDRRVSCAAIDLQCTGRNQPSRISWAIPRASLRSDFTGIALNASRTCPCLQQLDRKPSLLQPRVQPLR